MNIPTEHILILAGLLFSLTALAAFVFVGRTHRSTSE